MSDKGLVNSCDFGGTRSRLGRRVALLSAAWLPRQHCPFSDGEKRGFLSLLSLPR